MIKIMKYGQVPSSEIFARVTPTVDVAGIVADILYDVRKNGDKAVLAYCAKFDKAELTSLEVSKEEIEEARAEDKGESEEASAEIESGGRQKKIADETIRQAVSGGRKAETTA